MNMLKKFIDGLVNWKQNKPIVDWLLSLTKSYRKYIFGFLAINLVTMLISLGSAVASRYVVDAATGFQSGLFYRYILIMLVASVLSILIATVSSMFSSYVSEKFSFGLRVDLFDRVQRSVWHKLSKYHSGDLLSRLAGDVDNVSSTLISIAPNVIVTAIQLVLVLFLLLSSDPVLALIGLIVGPLGMISSVFLRKQYTKYQEQLRQSHSEYFSFLQESMASMGVVKTFQLEGRKIDQLQQIRNKRLWLVMHSARLSNIMGAIMRLIYSLGYVVTFSWCAYQLSVNQSYTYGTMTLFLSLVSQVQGSIRTLGGVLPQIFNLMVSAKRLYQISELENEDDTPGEGMPATVAVEVRGLGFGYEDEKDGHWVLEDLNFKIPAGVRVGVVGASGAGKTTFIRLLLALIQPTAGQINYVDESGNPEKARPASRRFISYVPQGNTLLTGSVRTNLLAGNPDATDEQMWAALEQADAAGFLRKSPQGLDTVLAESAGGLSEGQAQRISIARALLRDRPVLILDEATSALDENTEARIFQRISNLKGKTCFIITHRKSMLRYCDMLLTIDAEGHATLS